jgi:hypothetical protein
MRFTSASLTQRQSAGLSSRKRGFESRTRRQIVAAVAQSEERRFKEPGVGGSRPSCGTSFMPS